MNKNKRLLVLLITALFLLMIPLIGLQFTSEVKWSPTDFLVMGMLLFGVVLMIEVIFRKVPIKNKRIALIALILIGFLLIWAELAVGLFGTPIAGS